MNFLSDYKNSDNQHTMNSDDEFNLEFTEDNDQTGGAEYTDEKRLNQIEDQFMQIMNQAREYRNRIMNMQNQLGGDDDQPKKKREIPRALALILQLNGALRATGKYKDIPPKFLMKISKMIIDDAKKQLNTTELTLAVEEKAMVLVKNSDYYVNRFRTENPDLLTKKNTDTNSSNSSTGNSRKTTKKSSNMRYDDDFNIVDKEGTSNSRSYAQKKLWNDDYADEDLNRYGEKTNKKKSRDVSNIMSRIGYFY